MGTDEGATRPGPRPKSPVEGWFEIFVYAPLGFALDARQLLPRFIDRGRSQVVLARVVGRYAVERGSTRAGRYVGHSQEQVAAVLQALGLLPEGEPGADQADLDDFEDELVAFASPTAAPEARPAPPSPPDGAADKLAIPGYDNLSASQVVPRLGGLSVRELEAVRRYEEANRGRKTILNKIAQLRSA
jgi:hypothetical protein